MKIERILDRTSFKIVLPWILLFLVLNVKYYEDGDVNAFSRYAAMRAMAIEGTFTIDNFKSWTMDWSQSPNGHYYSNKAPGPMLLGYPLFWTIDHIKGLTMDSFKTSYRDRLTIGYEHKVGLPLVFQILPYCFLVLLVANYLKENGASSMAILFAAIALLFGNTAALFLTTWFGHGLTAWLVVGMYLSLHYQRFILLGLTTGLAILSDYSIGLYLIPIALYLITNNKLNSRQLINVTLGAGLPAILWIWYHTLNFGHPFALPNMYQNPIFGESLGGQFQFPNPYYMLVLLFGDQRGILYTQPWVIAVLVVAVYLFIIKEKSIGRKQLALISVMSFVLLLIMNSSFVGWHGGSTPGPRYLSSVFPLFAILAGSVYDRLEPWEKHILWVFLAVSVTFGGLVYGTTILVHEYYTIWTWLLDYLLKGDGSMTRIVIYFIGIGIVTAFTIWNLQKAPIADIES